MLLSQYYIIYRGGQGRVGCFFCFLAFFVFIVFFRARTGNGCLVTNLFCILWWFWRVPGAARSPARMFKKFNPRDVLLKSCVKRMIRKWSYRRQGLGREGGLDHTRSHASHASHAITGRELTAASWEQKITSSSSDKLNRKYIAASTCAVFRVSLRAVQRTDTLKTRKNFAFHSHPRRFRTFP